MGSKDYWNKKIIDWEKSSYRGISKDLSFTEKIATKFRGPIRKRKEVLLDILDGAIRDKVVIELGCGTGGLSVELSNRGAKKVVGIDIAENAIEIAKDNVIQLGLQGKLEFYVTDICNEAGSIDVDFVVGLGFIDYIHVDSLRRLFDRIKGKFIFSFPEKRVNLINILHYMYLKLQGCPSFYKYRRKDFSNYHFFERDKMVFITNFDISTL